MKLQTLLKSLHQLTPYQGEDPTVLSIHNDNRKVEAGSLFICIKGYTVDGHDFAQDAVEKGAVAVVSERPLSLEVPVIIVKDTKRAMAVLADAFYHSPSQKLQVIGITGTNGKTTTSHLTEHLFAYAGKKTGLIGTMYTKIGDRVQETKNTTPESLTLQKLFSDMVKEDVDTSIMEVSSHALVEGRVHGTNFDIAVFTNLTQDHLDYHGTMDEYKRAKGLLFAQLGNQFNQSEPKFAVLNADDEASKQYQASTAAFVMTYGLQAEADVYATDIEMTSRGTSFLLHTPVGSAPVTVKLVGKFNVYNILASVATALVAHIPLTTILEGLKELPAVAGRFEIVDAGQNFSVIVDYSHTPDSLKNALETISEFASGQTYVVVGCGGDRDRTKRPIMANIACDYADYAIFTSDNPRSEDPASILAEMEQGVKGRTYEVVIDRKEAIEQTVAKASKNDIILIAGKGHETYQIIGTETFHFDDREVAKEAILQKLTQEHLKG